jgi:hypothetical protein
MKRSPILIAILLLSLLLFSCELFIEEPQAGKVYAILVALDYSDTNEQATLGGTIPDAQELNLALKAVTTKSKAIDYYGYLFLQDASPPGTVTIGNTEPVNSLPNSANLHQAINNLKVVATPNDLIIFTYSGHGSEEGELVLATNEVYATSNLLDALQEVPGRKIMILDTCYSGVSIPETGASHSTLINNNNSKWYKK